MSKSIRLRVAEFSTTPGPRFKSQGSYSGEEFREKLLEPAFLQVRDNGGKVVVVLDGADGYPSSFLEEAFGGLARVYGIDVVSGIVSVECDDAPFLIDMVADFIRDANAETTLADH